MLRALGLATLLAVGLLGYSSIAQAERPSGRRAVDVETVDGSGIRIYSKEKFVGGQLARVKVTGQGNTELLLKVYDENGNVVASDIGFDCEVTWTPKWTGPFTIKVYNLGDKRASNNYFQVSQVE